MSALPSGISFNAVAITSVSEYERFYCKVRGVDGVKQYMLLSIPIGLGEGEYMVSVSEITSDGWARPAEQILVDERCEIYKEV